MFHWPFKITHENLHNNVNENICNFADKRKYVHKLLVNRLFKPAQEKVWLGELTVPQ